MKRWWLWVELLDDADEDVDTPDNIHITFIATVSLPPDAFHDLLREFSKHNTWKSGNGKSGRPPKLTYKHQALAEAAFEVALKDAPDARVRTFVTGTLLFGADRTIVWCLHNHAWSWNDGDTRFSLQMKYLDGKRTAAGLGVVAGSAFPVCDDLRGKIRTPLKDGDLGLASSLCHIGVLMMSNAITSLRQTAEWGMGESRKCTDY
ncbi:hypothetical protein H257_17280 [Aphanomyces astaci]|uniref:Uncharacterized protein n=1 Tax=Aphanomyces astaci TaxID=112090 RepID=W4FHA3_APHAT|nr:hypothetical protein H257_17280 [Aphanomyces astaci]ETV66118.1 hypothetical protein H257_17280 [Aphanomyces astaci]|eukprot:XP_009844307.1 hypothetical protein H257_17280 [Aphanomyces astaci]